MGLLLESVQLAAIGALLAAGIAACSILPVYGGWAALPAALLGLWVFWDERPSHWRGPARRLASRC